MLEKFRNQADVLLIPGAYKSGKIYGMNAKNGEIVPFTFTRAGAATYFDKNGVMQTAAAGMPRIDYDPITKNVKGYLLEAARTNFLINSDFVGWTITGGILSSVTDTIGNVKKMTCDVEGVLTLIAQPMTIPVSSITRSVYLKAGLGVDFVALSVYDNSLSVSTELNLITGAISAGGTGARTGVKVVNYGNGWWKLVITHENNQTYNRFRLAAGSTGYNAPVAVGAFFLIGFPQCEASTEDTSHIPTIGSQITRPTDYLASQNDLVNNTESSVFGQLSSYGQAINTVYYNRQNGGASGILYLSTDVRTFDSTSSVNSTTNLAQIKEGKLFKALSSWGSNGLALSIDGDYKRSTAPYDGTMGTPGSMIIRHTTTPKMHLKSFAVFNRQFTDIEHQEITEFTDETNAILSYARVNNYTLPSKTYIVKLENHIKALQAAGVWNKLDVAYFMAGDGDMNFKTINIVNPSKFKGTIVGGITNSNSGLKGNGLDGYIDTGYLPSTSGFNFTLNNASFGLYVTESVLGSILHGVFNTTRQLMINSNSAAQQINSSSLSMNIAGNFAGVGLKSIHRDDSLNLRLYNNSDEEIRTQGSSTNGYANVLFILRRTSAFGSSTVGSYFVGAALTAVENEAYRLAVINNL